MHQSKRARAHHLREPSATMSASFGCNEENAPRESGRFARVHWNYPGARPLVHHHHPASSIMSLRSRVLHHLRSRLADDPLPVRLVFWDGERFDFSAKPRLTITLHSARLLRLLLAGNFAALGEAYVKGEIGVEGAIEDVLDVGIALAERLGKFSTLRRLGQLARAVPRRHSRRQDKADIAYHYDVGNDFYRLWLDENMVYSCAYFCDGSEDIDRAQRQKLDHICRKLMLKPGDRLLDIGCGWGGLLYWAAQHYGVSGLGITLSERQCDYARERIAAGQLAGKVEIRLADYRDLPGDEQFDKIVSVGMYEHVGLRNLPLYFATVQRLLRPGGAFLNHGIYATDPDGRARGPAGGEFINRYVFPGGAVPHLSRAIREIARAGLEFADAEDLRPHYARTLMHWTKRLEAHSDVAIRAAGERRYRIWRVYLAGMAQAFERGWLSIAQVLAFRPAQSGTAYRPWTRGYQYAGPDALHPGTIALAGAPDWSWPPHIARDPAQR
jgi:cyclopropane-fatty-acyl-phospholipid synthase